MRTFAFCLLLLGCGDLKTASPAEDAGTGLPVGTNEPTSGTSSSLSNTGVLPSGFCCQTNDDCRYANCVEGMCRDRCYGNGICRRDDLTFTCSSTNQFEEGLCVPPAGFTCIPQNKFVAGARPVGACCAATGDGNAGEECSGNLCVAEGDGPFVCSKRCKTGKDCPSDYMCFELQEGDKECVPGNKDYTCH